MKKEDLRIVYMGTPEFAVERYYFYILIYVPLEISDEGSLLFQHFINCLHKRSKLFLII